jgi:hypothetical protein
LYAVVHVSIILMPRRRWHLFLALLALLALLGYDLALGPGDVAVNAVACPPAHLHLLSCQRGSFCTSKPVRLYQ